jgi:hypothetical protein
VTGDSDTENQLLEALTPASTQTGDSAADDAAVAELAAQIAATPAETLTEAASTQECSRGAMVDGGCSIYLKDATPSEIEAAFAQLGGCPS